MKGRGVIRNRRARRLRPCLGIGVFVALVIGLATAAPSLAAVHQFGTTAPGGSWGCPGADKKYGNKYTLTEDGLVTKITAYMKGNGGTGSQKFRTMIYAADGTAGAPMTLAITSQEVTVDAAAAPGPVEFAVSPPVSLPAGDYWIAQQSGATTQKACLSGTAGGTNDFNNDTYSDGPSNPFSASGTVRTDDNIWTLAATYETADLPSDTTAPTITAMAQPAANANGWNNTDVTVSFTCEDEPGGSGVGSVDGPTTLTAEGAGQSVTGTCTDNAGNPASATASGINIDKTAPVVLYTGNSGTYSADQTVTIGCTAGDALSGIASSTCANVSAPASSFGPGQHTLSASATDRAGNTATGQTTFTVVGISAGGLCNLTKQFVQASAKYAALNARQKAVTDWLWNAACSTIAKVSPHLNSRQKALAIALYKAAVAGLARGDWVTADQARTLVDLANGL